MAHKKGVGSTKNGRDSAAQRLGTKRAEVSSFWPATSSFVSAALTSSRVRMSARAAMIPCLLWSMAPFFRARGQERQEVQRQAVTSF